MPSLFVNPLKPNRTATLTAGWLGAIALATAALPAQAAPVTVDFDGGVDAVITSDDQFAEFLANLGFVIPNGTINEVVSGSITVDDEPSQYLDGDLSLGYDLLSATLGVEVDQNSIALLDSFFDVAVSGSGSVTTSAGVLDYSLSFDSANNELKAIFENFDPNNEIISACATDICDWSGQFSLSLDGVNFLDPSASLLPTQLLGSQGSFSFITNARSGGTVGDFAIATSNPQLQEKIDQADAIAGNNSASDPAPVAVAVQASGASNNGVAITQVEIVKTNATDVPEPSTIIGLGVLLGLGVVLKDRHQG